MIVITGGGTGGHLVIAKSIKDELNKRGIKPIYIGSLYGQDRDWFLNEDGFLEKHFFDTKGVVNKNFIGKAKSLFKILIATQKAFAILKRHKVTKVISVGGFSAAAASFACVIQKKELYIHEQNSIAGKLNETLRKYAKVFFSSYDDNSPIRDYPVDEKYFVHKRVRDNISSVIFLGGSLGARNINNFAIKVAPYLEAKNIKIIHQTGKEDYLEVANAYKKLGIVAEVFNFSKELDKKISQADFAISRAGASTLWELTANCVPTLFVPYPYASGDHQYYNAKYLLDKNLCFLQRETELNEEYLYDIINKNNIKGISQSLCNEISKDGVVKLVDKILEV